MSAEQRSFLRPGTLSVVRGVVAKQQIQLAISARARMHTRFSQRVVHYFIWKAHSQRISAVRS